MAVIGEAFIEVKPDAKGFGPDTERSVLSSVKGIAAKAAVIMGGAFVVKGTVSLFGDTLAEAEDARKTLALTNAVITSTGGAANVSADQLGGLATRLSNLSGIDDEVVQSADNVLLTFTNVKNQLGAGNDVFDQATTAALNMSAALGTDLQGATLQLGKALNDPVKGITALSRAGVSFTAEQKEQIKTLAASGDVLGAQKIVLAELNKEFAGAAEAAASPLDRLKVTVGNLKELLGTAIAPALVDTLSAVGDAAQGLEPVLTELGGVVGDALSTIAPILVDAIGPIASTLASSFGNIVEALAPVLETIGGAFVETFSTLGPVISDVAGVFAEAFGGIAANLSPIIGMIGNALEAVLPILGELASTFSFLFGELVGPLLESLGPVIRDLAASFTAAFGPIFESLGAVATELGPVFGQLGQVIGSTLGQVASTIGPVLQQLGGTFAAVLTDLAPVIATVAGSLGDVFKTLAPVIGQVVGLLADGFGQALAAILPAIANVAGALAPVVAQLVQALAPVLPVIANLVGQLAAALGGALGEVLTALTPVFVQIAQAMVDLAPTIADLAELVAGVLGDALETIAPLIGDVAGLLAGVLGDALSALLPVVADLVEALAPVVEQLVGALAPILPTIADLIGTLLDALAPLVSTLLDAFAPVLEAIAPLLSELAELLGGVLGDAIEAVLPIITGLVEALTGVIDFVTGVFSGDWGKAWDGIKQTFSGVWDAITGAVDGIVGFVAGLPGRIASAASGMWDSLKDGLAGVVNSIIGIWNKLDFAIGPWRIPDWVPLIGGKVFEIKDVFPDIPLIATSSTSTRARPGGRIPLLADGALVTAATPLARAAATTTFAGLADFTRLFVGHPGHDRTTAGPTLAVLGEAGPEVVLPLTNRRRMIELLLAALGLTPGDAAPRSWLGTVPAFAAGGIVGASIPTSGDSAANLDALWALIRALLGNAGADDRLLGVDGIVPPDAVTYQRVIDAARQVGAPVTDTRPRAGVSLAALADVAGVRLPDPATAPEFTVTVVAPGGAPVAALSPATPAPVAEPGTDRTPFVTLAFEGFPAGQLAVLANREPQAELRALGQFLDALALRVGVGFRQGVVYDRASGQVLGFGKTEDTPPSKLARTWPTDWKLPDGFDVAPKVGATIRPQVLDLWRQAEVNQTPAVSVTDFRTTDYGIVGRDRDTHMAGLAALQNLGVPRRLSWDTGEAEAVMPGGVIVKFDRFESIDRPRQVPAVPDQVDERVAEAQRVWRFLTDAGQLRSSLRPGDINTTNVDDVVKFLPYWIRLAVQAAGRFPAGWSAAERAAVDLPAFLARIPQLATGGVVLPRSGGTLALLGEAGRAEAVIPLPDGLNATMSTAPAPSSIDQSTTYDVGGVTIVSAKPDRAASEFIAGLDLAFWQSGAPTP